MAKVSIRNVSFLGLVIMGASAVTAAIMPKDKTRSYNLEVKVPNLQPTSSPDFCVDEQTCTLVEGGQNNCTVTHDSTATTSAGGDSSDLGTQAGGATGDAGNAIATSQGIC